MSATSSFRRSEFAALDMIRTASTEGAIVAHPTPDLQTDQGAYIGNVERLEDHAERLSVGSDLAEEIRKLHQAQKLSDSRRNSMGMDTPSQGDVTQRPRGVSNASHTSIVDVNNAAQWGGYSPSAFVASPTGSIRSGMSRKTSSASMQRQRSASYAARLPQLAEPASGSTISPSIPQYHQIPPSVNNDNPSSQNSFSEQMKALALDIQQKLDGHGLAATSDDRPMTANSTNTYQQAQTLFTDFDGVHISPGVRFASGVSDGSSGHRASTMSGLAPSAARQSWVQPPPEEGMVFYPAPVPRTLNLPQKLSNKPAAAAIARRREKVLSMMEGPDKQAAPWLGPEGAEAKSTARASKAVDLSRLPPQLRASMYFDAQPLHQQVEVQGDSAVFTLDNVLAASAALPADAFTDHPFAGHEGAKVYRKEGNAAARRSTALLNADKTASRKSLGASMQLNTGKKVHKRRSSFGLMFGTRPHSSGDLIGGTKATTPQARRLSIGSQSDRATVNAEIYHGQAPEHEPDVSGDVGTGESSQVRDAGGSHDEQSEASREHYQGSQGLEQDEDDEEEEIGEESEDDYSAPPTTLLAELQKRKAQQKSRTRTAATAFPGGMHSTLLEMDAVAEVEQKRRVKTRVPLAWEDPDVKAQLEAEDADDEVPLGLLFTKQNGVVRKVHKDEVADAAAVGEADWDRPLGLIEQRHLEDNEPLSKRRERLTGQAPHVMTKRNTAYLAPGARQSVYTDINRMSMLGLDNIDDQDEEPENPEEEGETLAQRIRRIKIKNAMGDAGTIAEADTDTGRPLSSDFAHALVDELGLKGPEKAKPKDNDGWLNDMNKQDQDEDVPQHEETLGQRRDRLQAQAKLQGDDIGRRNSIVSTQMLNDAGMTSAWDDGKGRTRSTLGLEMKRSPSMADLLAAHPLTAQTNTARKITDDALTSQLPAGSLLAQREVLDKRNKIRISSANQLNNTGQGVEGPLLNLRAPRDGEFDRGMLGRQERVREARMDAMRQSSFGVSMPAAQRAQTMTMGMNPMVAAQQQQQQMQMGMMGMNMGMNMGMPSPMIGIGMGAMTPNMMMGPMGAGMMGSNPMLGGGVGGAVAGPGMNSMMAQHQLQQHAHQQQQFWAANPTMMGGATGAHPALGMMGQHRPETSPQALALPQQNTYAAFAQKQMGVGGAVGGVAGMGFLDPDMRPEQRAVIDRWRQSVMP